MARSVSHVKENLSLKAIHSRESVHVLDRTNLVFA